MENSLVSVLMTSYNREQYIAEAIESVLASTHTKVELIVVDDGSSDRTVEIAKQFASQDKRVMVYQNSNNLGDYANRNKAASYATGEWIMSVDSDDKINPDGIEKVLNCMALYPKAEFGMSYFRDNKMVEFDKVTAIRKHLLQAPFLAVGPGGTIIKRKFFEKINGYSPKYGPAGDLYFNLKAASQTNILMLPFEFHFYRRHEGQEINNSFSYLYNNYNYLKDALNELELFLSPKEKKWLHNKNNRRFLVNLIKYFFKTRNIGRVKELLQKTGFRFKDAFNATFH